MKKLKEQKPGELADGPNIRGDVLIHPTAVVSCVPEYEIENQRERERERERESEEKQQVED